MTHSFAERSTLSCPQCGQPFAPEIWLIIDVAERPDLLARVREGTIHQVTCPKGHKTSLDAPFLIYQADREPHLIFALSRGMSPEEDMHIMEGLIARLREKLTARGLRGLWQKGQWQDSWVRDSLSVVPYSALETNVVRSAMGTKPVESTDSNSDLLSYLQAFDELWDEDLIEACRFLLSHPHLLTDKADAAMGRIITRAARAGDKEAVEAFTEELKLFRRARNVGVENAFAEQLETTPEALRAEIESLEAQENTPPELLDAKFRAEEEEQRYLATGAPVALNAAIRAWEDILNDPRFEEAPGQFRWVVLGNAAHPFLLRFGRWGNDGDLAHAIQLLEALVAEIPEDAFDRAPALGNLASALGTRFARFGQPADLDRSIDLSRQAITLTPPEAPELANYYHALGVGLHNRYTLGSSGDSAAQQAALLSAAIEAWEKALGLIPTDTPERGVVLTSLAFGLRDQYTLMDEPAYLERAIARLEEAVPLTPPVAPQWAHHMDALGNAYLDRYQRFGEVDDLKKALKRLSETLDAPFPLSPATRAELLNHQGNALLARYERFGEVADLEQAIANFQAVLASTALDSPNRVAYLSNLGNGLSALFAQNRQRELLDKAIEVYREAVKTTDITPAFYIRLRANLAAGLMDRYRWSEDIDDLHEAIRIQGEALDSVSPRSADYGTHLSNLAGSLSWRATRLGQMTDLNRAITLCQEAFERAPIHSPDRALRQGNLGALLGGRFIWKRLANEPDDPADEVDLLTAIDHCRQACLSALATDWVVALRAAQTWARLTSRQGAWANTLEAAGHASELLLRLDAVNTLTWERLSWRREAQGVAADAAYAHARRGDPRAAVLALETGQAGQLNAALGRSRDRVLLEQLHDDHPALFAAYEAAAEAVRTTQRAAAGERSPIGKAPGPTTDNAEVRRQAVEAQAKLDAVISRIIARPRYKALFAPAAFDDVAAAVLPDTPLVYLATTPAGSVILLFHYATAAPEVLWAGLTSDELDRLLVRREHAASNVGKVVGGLLPAQVSGLGLGGELAAALPLLGERLMAPLAARLRELGTTAVTLIPSGRLNLLPLHAASYAVDAARRAFLDEFVVTSAPSAQAAAESRARATDAPDSAAALVVGNPMPVHRPLRYAREEAEEVAVLLGGDKAFSWRVTPLYETEATLPTVAAALPGKHVLHFACHGTFDSREPLNSGLLMAGEKMLTLRTVRDGTALAGARLVVLSACQTGLTDFRELPDEIIGLPAGFLVAGAAGVVGSLWPVDDRSTALLMTDFYRRVLAGDTPAAALRAAQLWLRGVTWGELDAYYSTFLPRMSISSSEAAQTEVSLEDPAAVAYAEPYHWAAFTFSGA